MPGAMPSDTTARMAAVAAARHRVLFVIAIKVIPVCSFRTVPIPGDPWPIIALFAADVVRL
jgi:hypothetical protein